MSKLSNKETVIEVKNLHKKFCRSLRRSMFYGSLDVARNMLGISYKTDRLRKNEFWALENINFEVKRGEALGIIGENGSGKTTLLRLINGIFPPDKGKIAVRGKIGALIAVGAGFHPHMSGRENIYLNGTILGMSRSEIKKKFHEIVDFADIDTFIDSPVATYSSGMSIRLGFSIAINCHPEILLADEILAVGDLSFALKCYKKIARYREEGGSILLVSHGMQLVRNICKDVLWLSNGKVKKYGQTQPICDAYENFMFIKDSKDKTNEGTHVNNDPLVKITKVQFLDKRGQPCTSYKINDPFKARIFFECNRTLQNPIFTFGIMNPENIMVVANYSNHDLTDKMLPISGKGYVDFLIDKLTVKPGNYNCTITLAENENANVLDWHDKRFSFLVENNGKFAHGLLQPAVKWILKTTKP